MSHTDAPTCKPGLTRYFGVSRAENVEIACEVEANPSADLSYKWYFNNSAETIEVPRSRYNSKPSSGSSLLTYKPMASLDYGTLLCYATNAAGTQNEPCVFHILTAGIYNIDFRFQLNSNIQLFHPFECKATRQASNLYKCNVESRR